MQKKNIPHGVANVQLLPTIMEFNAPVCREKYIDALADQAIADVCTPGNPRKVTRDDIVALYRKVL